MTLPLPDLTIALLKQVNNWLSFWIFLEIRCDDAGIINYYLFIYLFIYKHSPLILLEIVGPVLRLGPQIQILC